MYEIEDFEAREIASKWHGGQSSPLYALASTGTVVSGADSEVRSCIRAVEADPDAYNPGEIDRLKDLEAYCDALDPDRIKTIYSEFGDWYVRLIGGELCGPYDSSQEALDDHLPGLCEACGKDRKLDPDFCPACLADMAAKRSS